MFHHGLLRQDELHWPSSPAHGDFTKLEAFVVLGQHSKMVIQGVHISPWVEPHFLPGGGLEDLLQAAPAAAAADQHKLFA